MSAAARGVATHRFMEKVRTFEPFRFEQELENMLEKGFLSREQAAALDKESICAFFQSTLAKRMAAADSLVREYEIAYLEDAGFFDPELPALLQKEQVFVDGMIDAAFIEKEYAYIVDYKTDRVKSAEELMRRYGKQMLLYRRAIEKVWGIPVKQCHVYSFWLNRDIVVEF